MSVNPWMPEMLANAGILSWIAVNLATAAAYFVLGLIVSRFFAAYGLFPAPIWLPAGVATVAAMAGGLISLHGGNINLESSIGRGTTAIVTIPANRVIAVQTADKPLAATPLTVPST
jgi:hypothetical protein